MCSSHSSVIQLMCITLSLKYIFVCEGSHLFPEAKSRLWDGGNVFVVYHLVSQFMFCVCKVTPSSIFVQELARYGRPVKLALSETVTVFLFWITLSVKYCFVYAGSYLYPGARSRVWDGGSVWKENSESPCQNLVLSIFDSNFRSSVFDWCADSQRADLDFCR